MERSLAEVLAARRTLGIDRALAVARGVLSALARIHAAGRAHGAVCPSHIRVRDGSGAASLGEVTAGAAVPVDYTAPEVVRGEPAGAAADLYALGCTLFECLAGRPPFLRGSEREVLDAHLGAEAPALDRLNPEVPEVVAEVIARALRKDAGARFAGAAEMLDAIEQADRLFQAQRTTPPRGKAPSRPGGTQRVTSAPDRPSKGGVTAVAPVSRARPARRSRRVRTAVALAAALGAIGAAGLWWTRTARVEDVAITFRAHGRAGVEWRTTRAFAGSVQAVPLSGQARERHVVEAAPATAHHAELELDPGRDYRLVVRCGGALWSADVNVPARPLAELRAAAGGAVVELAGAGGAAVLVPGGRAAEARAGERRGDRVRFALTSPPQDLEAGTYVEVAGVGWRARHHVRTAGELAMDVADALAGFDAAVVAQRLIADPRYDAQGFRQSVAYLFGAPGVGMAPEVQRRRAPRGHFRRLVREELGKLPWWVDLEAFRPLAAWFFAPATALAHRVRLYEQLLKLRYLELVCAGQGDEAALGVEELHRGFIDAAYALVPGRGAKADGERGLTVLPSPSAWFTEDYDQHSALTFWLGTHEFFPALFPDADPAHAGDLVKRFGHRRNGPALSPGGWDAAGTVRLRARVTMLSPDHVFEVRFRGTAKDAAHGPALLLANPGTDAWRAITNAAHAPSLIGSKRRPDMAGGPDAAGPSVIPWGQIDVRFPAALLPPAPFVAEVRYRSPPGARSRKLSGQQPTAYIGSLTLAPR